MKKLHLTIAAVLAFAGCGETDETSSAELTELQAADVQFESYGAYSSYPVVVLDGANFAYSVTEMSDGYRVFYYLNGEEVGSCGADSCGFYTSGTNYAFGDYRSMTVSGVEYQGATLTMAADTSEGFAVLFSRQGGRSGVSSFVLFPDSGEEFEVQTTLGTNSLYLLTFNRGGERAGLPFGETTTDYFDIDYEESEERLPDGSVSQTLLFEGYSYGPFEYFADACNTYGSKVIPFAALITNGYSVLQAVSYADASYTIESYYAFINGDTILCGGSSYAYPTREGILMSFGDEEFDHTHLYYNGEIDEYENVAVRATDDGEPFLTYQSNGQNFADYREAGGDFYGPFSYSIDANFVSGIDVVAGSDALGAVTLYTNGTPVATHENTSANLVRISENHFAYIYAENDDTELYLSLDGKEIGPFASIYGLEMSDELLLLTTGSDSGDVNSEYFLNVLRF